MAQFKPTTTAKQWAVPLVLIGGACALVAGIIYAGRETRAHIRSHDRYTTDLETVECTPPPGMQRLDFMSEVQYVGNLPRRLNLLDPGLTGHMATAFAAHPMVASVDRVELESPGRIFVQLQFRRTP